MAEHKIVPAPFRGINLSVSEQALSPEHYYAADIVNMLTTKRRTLRKRPGYRYFDTVPEGAVPLDIFEFGAITDDGLVPVVLWVGHQKIEIISALVLFPDNFTATPGSAQVLLTWDEVEDATYEIQYKLTTATDWTDVTGISGLSHTVGSLTNDSEYQFRIRSVIDGVNSKWKTITATPTGFTAAPGVPTNPRETIGTTSFTPMWDPASQALDYELRYREVGTIPYTTVSNIMGTSHEITGLTAGEQYEWQVRARNTFNTESFSARAPATPRQVTLATPNWFVTAVNQATVTLGDWDERDPVGSDMIWRPTNLVLPAEITADNLSTVTLLSFGLASDLNDVNILSTFDSPQHGIELIPAWEIYIEALTVRVGAYELTIPGPANPSNTNLDSAANYNWRSSQSVQSEIQGFIINLTNTTQTERDNATLTFRWGGKVYKSTDDGSNWDSGTDTPVTPTGFNVDSSGLWTMLGTNNMIYEKGAGAWGAAQAGPAGVTGLVGIGKDADGNLFVLSNVTDRFYQRIGITWNTGIPLPDWMTDPQSISEDDGNIYVLDAGTGKYGTYSDGSWDNGMDLPAAATAPTGIDVRAGVVYVGDDATDKVYKRENNAWDAGTDFPAAVTSPAGFAISTASLT